MILSTTTARYHTLGVARDEIKVRVLTLIFPSALLAFFDLYPEELRRALRKIICLSPIHTYLDTYYFFCVAVLLLFVPYMFIFKSSC